MLTVGFVCDRTGSSSSVLHTSLLFFHLLGCHFFLSSFSAPLILVLYTDLIASDFMPHCHHWDLVEGRNVNDLKQLSFILQYLMSWLTMSQFLVAVSSSL